MYRVYRAWDKLQEVNQFFLLWAKAIAGEVAFEDQPVSSKEDGPIKQRYAAFINEYALDAGYRQAWGALQPLRFGEFGHTHC